MNGLSPMRCGGDMPDDDCGTVCDSSRLRLPPPKACCTMVYVVRKKAGARAAMATMSRAWRRAGVARRERARGREEVTQKR